MNTSRWKRACAWMGLASVVALLAAPLGCTKEPEPPPTVASTPTELGVTVNLTKVRGPEPLSAKLSVSGGNHVRWINQSGAASTITFTTTWPFKEAQHVITLAAGDTSEWFSLDSYAARTAHFYHVSPPPDSIPPDEPDITSGN